MTTANEGENRETPEVKDLGDRQLEKLATHQPINGSIPSPTADMDDGVVFCTRVVDCVTPLFDEYAAGYFDTLTVRVHVLPSGYDGYFHADDGLPVRVRSDVGGSQQAILLGNTLTSIITVQNGACEECLGNMMLHELAHFLWQVRKLRRLSASARQQLLGRDHGNVHHDDLWGQCFAELYRYVCMVTTGSASGKQYGD